MTIDWSALEVAALIAIPILWIAAVYLTIVEHRLRALETTKRHK